MHYVMGYLHTYLFTFKIRGEPERYIWIYPIQPTKIYPIRQIPPSTPFYVQIKIIENQVKMSKLQIKITEFLLIIIQLQVKIIELQVKIYEFQVKMIEV